ncbi:membrane protein [Pseudomonas aeruginosa]|nr:membrane protein [Pseudomonas aeruginosa]
MPKTLWIERLDTHAEPFWRVRLGTRGICFRNERAAREFAALLHSRRAWQLERNAEEKGPRPRNEKGPRMRAFFAGGTQRPLRSISLGTYLPSSNLPIAARCTSSGPSARRRVRCMAYQ